MPTMTITVFCDVAQCNWVGGSSEMFRMNVLPQSSGSKRKPSKQSFLHDGYLFSLLFDSEDGDNVFLRNIGELLNYTPSYLRKWHLL
jgi:hypothetical protein